MIQRYMSKISGPLLDRIDIHIDVPAVNYKEMRSGFEPEGSAQIRERVMRARESQLKRFAASKREKLYCNAQMAPRHIRAFCDLSADCERLLERAMTSRNVEAFLLPTENAFDHVGHRSKAQPLHGLDGLG